jgi:chromosomal replication initiator protein
MDIIREVESFYNLSVNTLSSSSRAKKIVEPRHIAMYLCSELTSTSVVDIGKAFGGRDHTTVLHAVRKIKREMESNLDVIGAVNTLKAKIS